VSTAVSPPPRAEATEALGRAFKRAMVAVRRLRGRETHRPGTLSFAQYQLLFALADHDGLSSGELAHAADLSAATVTQMLDALVEHRLVTRVRSETDRRIVTCSLTDSGRDVIARRRELFQGTWDDALAGFSVSELAVAAAVFDRIAAMFDGLGGDV
jgi:DNA-binding MarR family transcriptional regulator